jgi:hypothetical protein
MFDHISMGKAVSGVLAMAKGNHGWGRYEADRGERSKRGRQLKAEPGSERDQHAGPRPPNKPKSDWAQASSKPEPLDQ